ncbi:beta-glucanase (GH16 family) [Marmoricola sp. OAE513]|uniref:glycoside hydrolase family 16 protein n=1 Tax=Marmoricola sp. OAE513 TaxID=2817894 RepID=UPI001AE48AAC
MFRAFLLVVTASVALLAAGYYVDAFDGSGPGSELAANKSQDNTLGAFSRPVVLVLEPPSSLSLRESTQVHVQAQAPAAPGDRVRLETAGTYGLGFVKVSTGYLDENLRATLILTGRAYLGTYKYWVKVPATGRYQEGQSATFEVTIGTPPPPAAPVCSGDNPVKEDGTPWVCTFDDEFDGNELNRKYWVPQETRTSGFTTGTRTRYACGVDSPDTISVAGGALRLSLVELPAVQKCGKKSSKFAFGQVMHHQTFSQTYGKYEIRARIPDVQVPGVQQSFWLWPVKNTYGGWPASGEIDFAEMYSNAVGINKPFIHYLPGEGRKGTSQNRTHDYCSIDVGEFNTYGVEWQPQKITVLVNGVVCFVNEYKSALAGVQGRSSPFDKPFYLAMNQAMGALGNEYDPAVVPDTVTTEIDYVRIWK